MISRTFISPEELYPGRIVTYADVAVLAGTLNRTECLKFLAYVNLVLSNATTVAKLKSDANIFSGIARSLNFNQIPTVNSCCS